MTDRDRFRTRARELGLERKVMDDGVPPLGGLVKRAVAIADEVLRQITGGT